MPDADDAVELRALQARAYRRGGTLSAADAERLQQLQDAARSAVAHGPVSEGTTLSSGPALATDGSPSSAASTVETPSGTGAPGTASASSRVSPSKPAGAEADPESASDTIAPDAGGSPDTAGATDAPASPARRALSTLRDHGRAVVILTGAALAVGLGVGWVVFSPPSDDIPLTAAQQDRQRELVDDGDYDPGSVRAVGKKDDALAWFGTKDDGELHCLTLDAGDLTDTQCEPTEDGNTVRLQAFVWTQPMGGEERGSTEQENVIASLQFSTSGEPMVAIERWSSSSAFLDQFSGDERTRAQELYDAGYNLNLSIVGSFRDEPVWVADTYTDRVEPETCLIVDGAQAQTSCGPTDALGSDGLSVVIADEGASRADVVTLARTSSGVPYLTIERDVEVTSTTVVDGTRAEVGGERGDPIEIGISSDDPDS